MGKSLQLSSPLHHSAFVFVFRDKLRVRLTDWQMQTHQNGKRVDSNQLKAFLQFQVNNRRSPFPSTRQTKGDEDKCQFVEKNTVFEECFPVKKCLWWLLELHKICQLFINCHSLLSVRFFLTDCFPLLSTRTFTQAPQREQHYLRREGYLFRTDESDPAVPVRQPDWDDSWGNIWLPGEHTSHVSLYGIREGRVYTKAKVYICSLIWVRWEGVIHFPPAPPILDVFDVFASLSYPILFCICVSCVFRVCYST